MGDRKEHVSPFFVPLIGGTLGFIAAWIWGAVWVLTCLLAYGLTGAEVPGPTFRPIAAVFSVVFVGVTLCGWISWLAHIIRKGADNAR